MSRSFLLRRQQPDGPVVSHCEYPSTAEQNPGLSAGIAEIPTPAIVVSMALHLRSANAAAIRLASDAGFTISDVVRGEGLLPGEWQRLRQAVQRVAAQRHESALELTFRDGCTWALLLRPALICQDQGLVTLHLANLSTLPRLPRSWMAAYGLTPCEVEVCDGILRGASAGEIAQARGVQEITVRCQVRAILEKVRVTSMRALCLKLSLLPR